MGDHGQRRGKIRETPVGALEDYNPTLHIILPKTQRRNKTLTRQMKRNAAQLITHFDIYATLVDIAKPENPRHKNLTLKGSSLFGPLLQPRNCDTLQIPFDYCMCQNKATLLKSSTVTKPLAEYVVSEINKILENDPQTQKCVKLSLNESAAIKVNIQTQLWTESSCLSCRFHRKSQ